MFDAMTSEGSESNFLTPHVKSLVAEIQATAASGFSENLDQFLKWRLEKLPASSDKKYRIYQKGYKRLTKTPEYRLANLVTKGGGTLGLAHAGMICGLEAAGIRFPSLAGTSAGAIASMSVLSLRGDDITSTCFSEVLDLIDRAPMDRFMDGPRPVRMLIKRYLAKKPIANPAGLLMAVVAWRRLLSRRGLNLGNSFEDWLRAELENAGIGSIQDLNNRMDQIASDLKHAQMGKSLLTAKSNSKGALLKNPFDAMESRDALCLITAAMPVGIKFKLPEFLKYLDPEYINSSPARLVRMSMAIPAFFEPVVMKVDRAKWGNKHQSFLQTYRKNLVSEETLRNAAGLKELTFVDGGVFSNMPFDVFDERIPDFPTIAVPIVSAEKVERMTRANSLGGLVRDALALIDSARMIRDLDAHDKKQKTGSQLRTLKIDTGTISWLNFVMSREDKISLFEAGLESAHSFICSGGNDEITATDF